MKNKINVAVSTFTDVVTARQQGRELARKVGFSSIEATLIATAISELARNIVLYAKYGTMSMEATRDGNRLGVAITFRDEGPGIQDVQRALIGGYTTSGGMGLGLSGVRRIMDGMDVESQLGKGTTVTIKKWLYTNDGGRH
ncbi:MAG: ATP-binding protein [Betaproteobacteria bacterium]|nr:ATP-binding protein [Betaproteobacteria bacterium]